MLQSASSTVLLSPRTAPAVATQTRPGGGIIPGRWLAWAILAAMAVLAVLLENAGLWIDPRAWDDLPFYAVGALAFGLRYGLRAPRSHLQRVVRDFAEYVGVLTLMVLMGAVASYPVAAISTGFSDAALQRIDVALHFDWLAWYEFTVAHRSVQLLGTIAYQSIYLTPAVLLGYFAWEGRKAEARGFLATFWIAAVLALTAFVFMPAVGPFAYLWHAPVPYMPESALWQPLLFPELRAHTLHHVDIGALRGLVSAPSFHTTSAVLFIATAWPIARLRWPVLAVNVAMLLSTPVEGTHYLIDMIAGAAVAIVALAVVAQLRRKLARDQRRLA